MRKAPKSEENTKGIEELEQRVVKLERQVEDTPPPSKYVHEFASSEDD